MANHNNLFYSINSGWKRTLFIGSVIALANVAAADTAPLVVVPLIPDNGTYQLATPFATTERVRRQERAEEAVSAPDRGPVNAESLTPTKNGFADATTSQVLSQIKCADISATQNEGGLPLVRFRGTRSFEPAFLFDEIPLSGVYGGAQTVELVPAPLLHSVDAFPDGPPWWFPATGISGAINLSPCGQIECFIPESENPDWKGNSSLAIGSFGFARFGSFAGTRLGERGFLLSGIQMERSREDFPVHNDNGTPFRKSDDFQERRRNNDYSRMSGGLVAGGAVSSWPGRWMTSILGGHEERGLAGTTVAKITPRLSRSLAISSTRIERFFPASGAHQSIALAGLADRASVSYRGKEPVSFSPSKSEANSAYLAIRGTLPIDVVFPGVSGLALFLSHQTHQSQRYSAFGERVDASRTEETPSLFQSWIPLETQSLTISADATLKANFAQSATKISCSTGASGCSTSNDFRETPLISSVISFQAKGKGVVTFVRHSRLQRRPWLRELSGEAGSVYPSANLKPETSSEIEGGFGTSYAQITCFAAQDRDLIILDAKTARDGRFENLDSVWRKGCAADAEFLIWAHLKPGVTWRTTRATFTTPTLIGAKALPRTPRHSVDVNVALEQLKFFELAWESRTLVHWQSESYLDAANQIRFTPPVRLDSSLSTHWASQFATPLKFTLTLDALNLWQAERGVETDGFGRKVTTDHGGFSGFPLSGRRFALTLSLDW